MDLKYYLRALCSVLGDGLVKNYRLKSCRISGFSLFPPILKIMFSYSNCVSRAWWWRSVVSTAVRQVESWEAAVWQRGLPWLLPNCLYLFTYLTFLLAAWQSWIFVIHSGEIWLPKELGFVHDGIWTLCMALYLTRVCLLQMCLCVRSVGSRKCTCSSAGEGRGEGGRGRSPENGKFLPECRRCFLLWTFVPAALLDSASPVGAISCWSRSVFMRTRRGFLGEEVQKQGEQMHIRNRLDSWILVNWKITG